LKAKVQFVAPYWMAGGKAELLNQEKTMARQTIWKTIAQSSPKQLIAGYTELIQQRIDEGFSGFLLTFMFKQPAGSPRGRYCCR
jgi:hypothetical protein